MKLRKHPVLIEINAVIFLRRLSQKYGKPMTLAEIPQAEWNALAVQGFDMVWLMGLWKRSPEARKLAVANSDLRAEYARILPDWKDPDILGSPYAVYDYTLDPSLGGPESIGALRKNLRQAGLLLMADYVPNHLALDHPWTVSHPEYFVSGTPQEAGENHGIFFEGKTKNHFAHGKDPNFPSWKDTVQVNFFSPEARKRAADSLLEIAENADAVRCDMAMLAIHRIFEKTWGKFAKYPKPQREFWEEVILKVREKYPDFIFMAESYWDTEWELQQMGFDFTYDKRLYDRLLHASAMEVSSHLRAEKPYQSRMARFIENHDEPRALEALGPAKALAAAAVIATLPGLRFFQEGQQEGRKIRIPVQLGKEPAEQANPEIIHFYERLLGFIKQDAFHDGEWYLNLVTAENQSHKNLLSWSWFHKGVLCLIAVNYSDRPLQGMIQLRPEWLKEKTLSFEDRLSGTRYERNSQELAAAGLYVDLPAWGMHWFEAKT